MHGYWLYVSGDCPSTADVTVQLQALACNPYGCSWLAQESATVTGVTPGSGTGHWATPHHACTGTNLIAWRGETWAGLTNFWHPYQGWAGPAQDLSCQP